MTMMSWHVLFVLCFLCVASTTAAEEEVPQKSFDTVFLVDSSSNVKDKEKYELIRRFVVNLTLELVNTKTHRVGIVSFSGVVYRMILPLTDDESLVHEGMKGMLKTGGYSYVSAALNYTFGKMFNRSIHIGDGKQIVTVLGGRPHNYDAITKMATFLKAKGLEMYSVGIGNDFFKSTKELRALASLPVKDHTLRTTYKSLLKSTPVMLKKLKRDGYGFIYKKKKFHNSKSNAHNVNKVQQINKITSPKKGLSPVQTTTSGSTETTKIIDATEGTNFVPKSNARIYVRRRNVGNNGGRRPNLRAGEATVATPPTAPADLSSLIKANTSSAPVAPASCVGHIPADNRIVTNGTMVTGIIANNTVLPSHNRACDPTKPLEEGINVGDSGIDSTWDYGK